MREWITGMDLSSLDEVERCGGSFFDHGKKSDAMEILKSYGMNMVRLRVWNDPYDESGKPYGAGSNDLETTLRIAARAKALGVSWLLDLHYSDFWADPGKQRVPKAWRGMNAEELEKAVYDYTLKVLGECHARDLDPAMVAVGNELSNGLLWPLGRTPHFDNIAKFVSAGIRAVREFAARDLGEETAGTILPTMIHLDNGGNNTLYRTWFDSYLENGGADFEYIGLSYYPFWHGSLKMLKDNMTDLAGRYHKKMIVAEVSMGYTMEDYQSYEKLPDEKRKGMATKPELAALVPYPMTPDGQAEFMQAILTVIQEIPDELGCGFFYWEPAWLPVPGSEWSTEEGILYMEEKGPGGNEWANQALFDYEGNALPALEIIKKAAEI